MILSQAGGLVMRGSVRWAELGLDDLDYLPPPPTNLTEKVDWGSGVATRGVGLDWRPPRLGTTRIFPHNRNALEILCECASKAESLDHIHIDTWDVHHRMGGFPLRLLEKVVREHATGCVVDAFAPSPLVLTKGLGADLTAVCPWEGYAPPTSAERWIRRSESFLDGTVDLMVLGATRAFSRLPRAKRGKYPGWIRRKLKPGGILVVFVPNNAPQFTMKSGVEKLHRKEITGGTYTVYRRREDFDLRPYVISSIRKMLSRDNLYRKEARKRCQYLVKKGGNKEAQRFLKGDQHFPSRFAIKDMASAVQRVYRPQIEAKLRAVKRGDYHPTPLRTVNVPKSSGGFRPITVYSLADRIVIGCLQIKLQELCGHILSPKCIGGVPGRSFPAEMRKISKALPGRHHCKIDIEDFFGSIRHDKMRRVLQGLTPEWAGRFSALFETGRNGRGLPQGGPTSPTLANLYMDTLVDREVPGFMRRYLDDIVLIGERRQLEKRREKTLRLLEEAGMSVSPRKCSSIRSGELRFLGLVFEGKEIRLAPEVGDSIEREPDLERRQNRMDFYMRVITTSWNGTTVDEVLEAGDPEVTSQIAEIRCAMNCIESRNEPAATIAAPGIIPGIHLGLSSCFRSSPSRLPPTAAGGEKRPHIGTVFPVSITPARGPPTIVLSWIRFCRSMALQVGDGQ